MHPTFRLELLTTVLPPVLFVEPEPTTICSQADVVVGLRRRVERTAKPALDAIEHVSLGLQDVIRDENLQPSVPFHAGEVVVRATHSQAMNPAMIHDGRSRAVSPMLYI